ncbi:MAG: hypothetical protein GX279_09955 [Clostridiaceae bacterium]|nr:hypothetical protein [Clostridiaceae bacterium]
MNEQWNQLKRELADLQEAAKYMVEGWSGWQAKFKKLPSSILSRMDELEKACRPGKINI